MVVNDGPLAEAKEHYGGYLLVECESEECAVEIAKGWPSARFGAMEVRALMNQATLGQCSRHDARSTLIRVAKPTPRPRTSAHEPPARHVRWPRRSATPTRSLRCRGRHWSR
jgi:YCII-related domain